MKKAKKQGPKKRAFTVEINETLFNETKEKARLKDVRLRAIVEKAFRAFLDS